MSSNPKRRRKRWLLFGIGGLIFAAVVAFILHMVLPHHFLGTGQALVLTLPHGKFETLYYNLGRRHPKGIVIVATGDGGWSYWEENVAKHLSGQGYAVGGWDCRKFADTRTYDAAELSAGFRQAVEVVRKHSGAGDVPIWYLGWSTGAEQSVAAAAFPGRPDGLVGLLLAAPGRTGRYGIDDSDLLGVEPQGENTFRLSSLAPKLKGLKIVQFAAGLDPLDDTSWLPALGDIPHQLIEFPTELHDMGGAGDEFLKKVDEAMSWTLKRP
ncbi:hypothetical protein JIN85_06855 [Luteolibacter pohnpeiensis]|uniref:Bacterial virulence domain-containing protein n=1 Tax=Luteolibacter pohnpeiensis TaxID=454153 RepID=A0A934VVF6_9BACT|nr:AcvB/VirJ family lysyl-phosphatidylglycerol hydrolase [Luteolibacter pohnpeiensis]MBK1882125.1 hypothetical protein [Luteolibacter pohnpeiensis]